MDRYKKFEALKALTALEEGVQELRGLSKDKMVTVKAVNYGKLVMKGQLAMVDYNRGAFHVEVQVILDGTRYKKGETEPENDPVWQVMLNVVTVDDGDLGGCSKHLTLKKANARAGRVAQEVLTGLQEMPTLEEFQTQLRPYGIPVEVGL